MSILQSIRYFFGIGNDSLAHYLRISISMMQSISNGRRRWTLQNWSAIMRLYNALDIEMPLEQLQESSGFLSEQKQEAGKQIAGAISRLERDLRRKEEQLEKLNTSQTNMFRGLQACEFLLSTDLNPHEKKWVETRRRHLQGKLKEKSLFKTIMLQIQVDGSEAKINQLKMFLIKLEG